ncbi:hypothetical protein VNO80_23773 [Phaseolus coccineus]|uniref:Uncharacterized protein n=1 Tax=Phaseolus coccineus TaxID=3886 RepID=A0AAN9M6Y2_PHACN
MFEPRDMWTKLKEKGETIFSRASRNPSSEPSFQGIREKEKSSSTGLPMVSSSQHMQVQTLRLMCTEASLSMLVDCFSA